MSHPIGGLVLVAVPPAPDLLISAKSLVFVAMIGPAGRARERCLRICSGRGLSECGRSGPLHWPQSANIWPKGTSLRGGARRQRGMTTILRQYHSVARCTLLGEIIEDTATRYYYRLRSGDELTFVEKSPAIHLTPCPACPDWPASQQRGIAVGTNSR